MAEEEPSQSEKQEATEDKERRENERMQNLPLRLPSEETLPIENDSDERRWQYDIGAK